MPRHEGEHRTSYPHVAGCGVGPPRSNIHHVADLTGVPVAMLDLIRDEPNE